MLCGRFSTTLPTAIIPQQRPALALCAWDSTNGAIWTEDNGALGGIRTHVLSRTGGLLGRLSFKGFKSK